MAAWIHWWLLMERLIYVSGETYQEYVETSLSTMCPFSTFCKQGPSKPFTYRNNSPCCKPCSCESFCKITGNCCPDYDFIIDDDVTGNHTMTSSAMECKVPAYTISKTFSRKLTGSNFGIKLYYVIDTCPDGHNHTVTASLCGDPRPANLLDAVAVSDSNGRVYKNRHCAKCNGIQKYTTWVMNILCIEFDVGPKMVHLDLNHISEQNCIVYSEPYQIESGLVSRCFKNNYNKCNETGRWRQFNEHIQIACDSSTFSYFSDDFKHQTYKNPFCYLCNVESPSFGDSICKSDTIDTWKFLNIVPFWALFNIDDIVSMETKNLGNGECTTEEIRDPYFDICRPLKCPFATIPRSAECINPYQAYKGLGIGVQIEFSVIADDGYRWNKIAEAIRDLKAPTTSFLDVFLDEIDNAIGCPACRYTFFVNKAAGRIDGTLVLVFATTPRCLIAELLDKFDKWRNNMKVFKCVVGVKNVSVNSTIFHDFKDFEDSDTIFSFLDDVSPGRKDHFHTMTFAMKSLDFVGLQCPLKVTMLSEKFYCAFVEISENEYTWFLAGGLKAETVELDAFAAVYEPANHDSNTGETSNDLANNETNLFYRICLTDYFKTTSGTISFRQTHHETFICIAFLTLLYIG